MRSLILTALSTLCLLFLPACDDSPESETGAAPALSDLSINTDVSAVAVGESVTIDGSMTVIDPDGDVSELRLTVNLPDGSSQDLPTSAVAGTAGMTAFSMQVLMVLRPPVAGDYRVDLRVDDAQGNLSEPVSFTVTAQ